MEELLKKLEKLIDLIAVAYAIKIMCAVAALLPVLIELFENTAPNLKQLLRNLRKATEKYG